MRASTNAPAATVVIAFLFLFGQILASPLSNDNSPLATRSGSTSNNEVLERSAAESEGNNVKIARAPKEKQRILTSKQLKTFLNIKAPMIHPITYSKYKTDKALIAAFKQIGVTIKLPSRPKLRLRSDETSPELNARGRSESKDDMDLLPEHKEKRGTVFTVGNQWQDRRVWYAFAGQDSYNDLVNHYVQSWGKWETAWRNFKPNHPFPLTTHPTPINVPVDHRTLLITTNDQYLIASVPSTQNGVPSQLFIDPRCALVMAHELGHHFKMGHEHQRADAGNWMAYHPDRVLNYHALAAQFGAEIGTDGRTARAANFLGKDLMPLPRTELMEVQGSAIDWQSIMLYGDYTIGLMSTNAQSLPLIRHDGHPIPENHDPSHGDINLLDMLFPPPQ
ncbi:hypothetical protein MMC09_002524 [Bachmanniomyces sp. S44760]|nr:hypothetical protein [Bachmanniomyces sp. S44760]